MTARRAATSKSGRTLTRRAPRGALSRKRAREDVALRKADPAVPALVVNAAGRLCVRGATQFAHRSFAGLMTVPVPKVLEPGADYVVLVGLNTLAVEKLVSAVLPDDALGGFHFAPGGNAPARGGGNTVPAINPCSLWDLNFRPACNDPRGMTLVRRALAPPANPLARGQLAPAYLFWCDIYLTGVDHLQYGTSRFDVTIADGVDLPQKPDGNGLFEKFDFAAARALLAHHGKGLLSFEEFGSAAIGVTEETAAGTDPKITGLDAPRTSRFGLMQATGNMWVWGHDGDPDEPRASIFGGSWHNGGYAGSRCANVDYWPASSGVNLGARGRCDHLMRA
jgi:hypothetical protein